MLKRKWLLGLLLLAGLLANTPAVRAGEDDASPGRPYVVLVGIDKYQDPQIKSRKHAEDDARALYDLFTSKDYLAAPAANVKLLLGGTDAKRPNEKATRANILKALTWLEQATKANDLVIFAFLGEGAPHGERSCYFALDSTFNNRDKDAIAGAYLEEHLEKIASERFLGLIDVHFLGFDPGKEPMPDFTPGSLYRDFVGGDETKDTSPSRIVMMANNGVKPSLDLDTHGILAAAVLDGLRGKADVAGYEGDGVITAEELVKFVRKKVHELALANGKTEDEKGQLPFIIENHNDDFVVGKNPAVYAKAQGRLQAFDAIAKEKELPRDVTDEGRRLLGQMPRLDAQQALRKIYQKLADKELDVAAFSAKRKEILAETRITETEASKFATYVMRGANIVKQEFVKEANAGTLVDHAIEGLYKGIRETPPPTIKDKLDNVKSMKDFELLRLLTEVRAQLGKREDLARGKDVTLALNAMLTKLDKHTYYYDPDAARRLGQDTSGKFTGVGVQIRKNNVRDQLQVITPIYGSPAYKAGLKANDIITTIIREVDENGKKLKEKEVISTTGMSTEDAVKKILGEKGTPVKLIVDREGAAEPLEFNLIRGSVEVETVLGIKRNTDDSWNYVIDPANKICYVRLTQFSENTAKDLSKLMKTLYKGGIKGFVLDLRFNPGGLLPQSVEIANLFIDDGLIVTVRPRNKPEMSYVGKADGTYTTFPMVCLVNGGSASASEIVSACLQDHGRCIVVGSRSYGKGSVQTIHYFPTDAGKGKLKLTTATFWRPSGRNLNKASTKGRDEDEWGVMPNPGFDLKLGTKEQYDLQDYLRDQEIIHAPGYVPSSSRAEFRDRQLEMALDYLRGQIKIATQSDGKKPGGQ